jgi:hypothetical protein
MTDNDSFNTINGEIDKLLAKFDSKGVCPCCVATAIMYRAAMQYAEAVGTDEAVELCKEVADALLDGESMPKDATAH